MKHMSDAVERELHALPAYYGESPNSAEAVKPKTFFQFIVPFSSSLQASFITLVERHV
jgi:hypothetical protein